MSTSLAWDDRYQNGGFEFGEAPNLYLQSQAHRLRPGMRALAVGDGEGRNGVWLAGQGLEVTSVDWSGVGLAKAASLARQRGVALQTMTADVSAWEWPRARCPSRRCACGTITRARRMRRAACSGCSCTVTAN